MGIRSGMESMEFGLYLEYIPTAIAECVQMVLKTVARAA